MGGGFSGMGGGFSGMGEAVAAVWEIGEHTPFLFVHS